jgi:hypothetical protein
METDNLRNTDNARILLIDDDDASCRDLALLLDFLGEHAVGARHSNWRVVMAEAFETSNAIKLVLVSPCATEAMTTPDQGSSCQRSQSADSAGRH